jgi:DNA invertase Pin-like site-specific DNA recombinase
MKALVYYRMSSDQQTDSIERQKSEVEPIIQREGDEVLAVYIDRGKSGSKHRAKRKDFLRMMKDVKNGTEAKKLYLWDLARFTRENPFKAAEFYALLMDKGIVIHDCKFGVIDLSTQQGRMIVSFIQEQNHAFSTTISSNTTSGRRHLLTQGWWVAGAVPFGYVRRYVGPSGEEVLRPRMDTAYKKPRGWHLALAEHEKEAKVVRRIFKQYVHEDLSFRDIARRLNEQGVPPPSGDGTKGWKKDAVRQVIGNRAYCGYAHIGGSHRRYRDAEAFGRIGDNEVKSDKVPAIVPETLWKRAEAKRKKQRANRANVKPTQAGMLSGILYCGHCRYALAKASRNERDGNRYVYYHCQTGIAFPAKCTCHQWRVREDVILPVVVERLFKAVDFQIGECLTDAVQGDDNEKIEQLQAKLAEIEAATTRANRRFLTASATLPAGQADRMQADLQVVLEDYQRERNEIENDLRRLRLDMEAKHRIAEGFEDMKTMIFVRYPFDHPIAKEFDPRISEYRKAAKPGVIRSSGLRMPVCRTDQLRGFLKSLGAKAYIWWRPKAVRDKHGNVKRTANGEVCRSRRSFEVDAGQIVAEFDLQDLADDNVMRGPRTSIWS